MASDHSTGSACPAKTLSYAELTAPCLAAFYIVSEPERAPYGRTVSDAAKRLASNVRLLRTVRGWLLFPKLKLITKLGSRSSWNGHKPSRSAPF